ncbi:MULTISPECIES: hypothetical protein [unclassified Paraburkholderia]|uniref:hypothetical protein n=1 Tax=unclassified Paraburkholderia TaxID=2615204 RepID=UPI0020B7B929|nr:MULTISPECIES: hypothetical protein [unclassified Paraburkholderia]MCP3721187.1 hypothetical protein [Paraburkholderia sp. CNPSo 3281]MCX5545250.1 hypothetical protein [Paraburkholderia sp. CNPSo 3076]
MYGDPGSTMVGVFSAKLGLGAAMGICACVSYLLVVTAALLLPETRGRDLGEVVQASGAESVGEERELGNVR